MEILIAIHPEEYPADAYERCADALRRLADGDAAVTLRLAGEGAADVDGGYDAAVLRDVADALGDVGSQAMDYPGPVELQ